MGEAEELSKVDEGIKRAKEERERQTDEEAKGLYGKKRERIRKTGKFCLSKRKRLEKKLQLRQNSKQKCKGQKNKPKFLSSKNKRLKKKIKRKNLNRQRKKKKKKPQEEKKKKKKKKKKK